MRRATDGGSIVKMPILLLVTASLAFIAQVYGQAAAAGGLPQDLANALAQVARVSHNALVAEIALPMPKVSVPDRTDDLVKTLNRIVKQSPGYEWKMEDQIIHFYNKRLYAARYNALNLRFADFTLPPTVSDLKLWLPTQVSGLAAGYKGTGGAISGFSDALLGKQTLPPIALKNVSGRDVLLRAGRESPAFYAIVVFPQAVPTKKQAPAQVWFWGSVTEQAVPIYAPSAEQLH